MKFTDLNSNIVDFTVDVNIGNNIIKVKQYLPFEDKYDLMQCVLQNSKENGIYDPLLLDMYFHLYVVYMYSDIEFTEDEKSNPAEVFDVLQSNGVIEAVVEAIDDSEWAYINNIMNKYVCQKRAYDQTIASVLHSFIDELPEQATKAADILQKFKPEDFQQVINFALAANGGRPIN